jgi:hypothetical protein
MSSFNNPHFMYLFSMVNGKKKLAYGRTPEDALEILAMRLTPAEMAQIIKTDPLLVNQRQLQSYVPQLG